MAETPSKRPREETQIPDEVDDPKRLKSYNQILSLLEDQDEEEQQPNQDFSSFLTTLERELSCGSNAFEITDPFSIVEPGDDPNPHVFRSTAGPSPTSTASSPGQEEDEGERVMRHLLEASDDELGLPNRTDGGDDDGSVVNRRDEFSLCDGLWELEDEAANYNTLLQSELFM